MASHLKKMAGLIRDPKRAAHRLIHSRYLRRVFIYHLYRRALEHSEYIVSLMRNEEDLDESYWIGILRKNAHIVDKGLHRLNYSKGHGRAGYQNIKRIIDKIRSEKGMRDPAVQWAKRLIAEYERLQGEKTEGLSDRYQPPACGYEALFATIKTRRSIRRYKEQAVSLDVLNKITDVMDWAPTSCHRQPVRIYASTNPTVVRESLRLHAGAACFTEIYTPLFMMFCADTRLYSMPDELFAPHIDTALGVENCVLAAHSLGVSLTLLNCSFRTKKEEAELRRLYSIPPYLQIIVSAAGGYPDLGALIPPRKIKELNVVN